MYIHVCVYIHIYLLTCILIYTHTYIYIFIYIYVYIQCTYHAYHSLPCICVSSFGLVHFLLDLKIIIITFCEYSPFPLIYAHAHTFSWTPACCEAICCAFAEFHTMPCQASTQAQTTTQILSLSRTKHACLQSFAHRSYPVAVSKRDGARLNFDIVLGTHGMDVVLFPTFCHVRIRDLAVCHRPSRHFARLVSGSFVFHTCYHASTYVRNA